MGEIKFVEMKIDFDAIDKLYGALEQYPKILKEELGKAVKDLCLAIEGKAKEFCPVDTGRLRASLHTEVQSWLEAYVATNVEYAAAVEDGTKPHEISAKEAKALAFEVVNSVQIFSDKTGRRLKKHKDNMKTVIVRRVKRHPGTTAQPFLEPAFEWGKENASRYFDAALKRVNSRLERLLS